MKLADLIMFYGGDTTDVEIVGHLRKSLLVIWKAYSNYGDADWITEAFVSRGTPSQFQHQQFLLIKVTQEKDEDLLSYGERRC